MARLNVMKLNELIGWSRPRTHEGAPARSLSPEQQLRRSVLACLLWENQFYEDGVEIAGRIKELVPKVAPEKVAALAVEARTAMKLRHAPLLLVREMARLASHRALVAETLERVIQRADELSEFVAIYWSDGRAPLSAQVKKGLAAAFPKFDEYALAKYNRDSPVKLRDVLFLSHAKPRDEAQAELWKRLVEGKLATPDTWEVALSGGANQREAWTRLLGERKLGALAVLRNLRNMYEAGVDEDLVLRALRTMKTDRVLPFRFIAAARHAPQWEAELESVMLSCCRGADAEAEGQDRPAGGRVGLHGRHALAPFGDAAHRCRLRTGNLAARDLRGRQRLQLLRSPGSYSGAARVRLARRHRGEPVAQRDVPRQGAW